MSTDTISGLKFCVQCKHAQDINKVYGEWYQEKLNNLICEKFPARETYDFDFYKCTKIVIPIYCKQLNHNNQCEFFERKD